MAKNASEAFALLCQDAGQPAINLVMVDAYLRHDMDVFKFLRIITFQFNLPAIMMLHNGKLTNQFVCKAIDAGACECLLRPIRLEEIKICWQHVMIRRHNAFNSFQEKPTMQMNLEQMTPPYVQSLPQPDPNIGRECPAAIQLDTADGQRPLFQENIDNVRHFPLFQENIDNIRHSPVLQKCDEQIKELEPSRKKRRIKWNDKPFLQRKFILAVEQLGIDSK
ncbi:hypothetical protein HPP92_007550 [Vanilla planifolia]|uniref:Response regulatory domain-containing protein n=1 Tax=Vanilla planifolia TaxID=51239 RepID=A0A835V9Q4_VANPL|nr:hypothetical protein HPP92_007770 [Vanilla planifolia]KAG0490687.1 hypothetical protein HPP92_007550 [Vanilla planifolia]